MDARTQLAPAPVEDFENGDFLMATKILTTRIRHDPNNYELYFERSICNHKLGNYQASLDDADAAIRLNPSDFNVHYQKSLALMRLHMYDDSLRSALKAIELRAARSDTKMSDIFKLIKDHSNQMKIVRGQAGDNNNQHQVRSGLFGETGATSSSQNANYDSRLGTSGEPVDSTTDRLLSSSSKPSSNQNNNLSSNNNNNNNNVAINKGNLVITNCNSKNQNSLDSSGPANRVLFRTGPMMGNKVTSSAIHCSSNNNLIDKNDIIQSQQMSSHMMNSTPMDIGDVRSSSDHHHHHQLIDQCKSPSQFEWNIRRSERIFLHNTSEPGTSSPQLTTADQQQQQIGRPLFGSPKQAGRSNVSSVDSVNKQIDQRQMTFKVDDSEMDETTKSGLTNVIITSHQNLGNEQHKRVIVTPSSSMPVTSQIMTPISKTVAQPIARDNSYSSKYKRLRRDRERARRGTSKLCTIRPSDLEELHKANNSEGKHMRVIAPIDGWLYSGQLSVDDGPCDEATGLPHYVVKLDGDASRSVYLFTQETVLNDVIKEVRVKSVSDLRKGARICCYWSRTYKCLSTGVVTSRTFEATKSLVSVKYDNGDLSALPLEDLRLLPPDYPKYMSNCDPLLLSRNGDGLVASFDPIGPNKTTAPKIMVANKMDTSLERQEENASFDEAQQQQQQQQQPSPPLKAYPQTQEEPAHQQLDISDDTTELSDDNNKLKIDESHVSFQPIDQDETDDDDDVIPPTNQAIDFITNEDLGTDSDDAAEEPGATIGIKGELLLTSEVVVNGSRASSEENNFGVEYRPWVFEGAPKRNKRHGRTYRDNYTSIRRGNEILKIGDSAELMPRDSSVLPFIAKIDGLWCTSRGEMRVRVRWYYRLVETEDEPSDLKDGENALFETDHFDENDVQSIWRSTKILTWTEYSKSHLGHANKQNDGPKVFYLAGYYDPVRRVKHLRSDVKEAQ